MSTYADLVTEIKQTVEGWPGAPVRMVSDHRSDLERIPAGATRYQLRVAVAGMNLTNSNTPRVIANVSISIYRRLVNAFSERAYTESDLQAYLALLTDVRWWRSGSLGGLAASYALVEGPAVEIDRVGNIVVATATASVVIATT